jgi:hypothetical protein
VTQRVRVAFAFAGVLAVTVGPLSLAGLIPEWWGWSQLTVALLFALYAVFSDNRRQWSERARAERKDDSGS